MKLLILGGTVFLGRHIVEEALRLGHEVTLFNRGQSNPDLFQNEQDHVHIIHGDRDKDLAKLSGLTFDACIDPSGYLPKPVSESAKFLADAVETYVFISSISVYPRFTQDMDETGELAQLPADGDATVYRDEDYGALKVLCEQVLEQEMPGRALHVRSGLIVGPFDPTHRFTYWPARVSRGGDMLAPVRPDLPIQFIDARDQALWILHMLESRKTGVYNVTGPWQDYTLADLIDSSERVSGATVNPVWADSEFLIDQQVAPWMGLPMWLPEEALNMSRVNVDKAVDAGLRLRPLDDTVRDTLNWFQSMPRQDWPAGISDEKEQQVLAKWLSRR